METNIRFYDLDEKDDWQTPPDLIADIEEAIGRIDLDPCAHPNTTIGRRNYRIGDGEDGLKKSWWGTVFVNPPFSYKKEWLEKVVNEVQHASVDTVILLTPDSTDTKSWWHEFIAPHARYVCFCKGRVSYYDEGEQMDSPTFGTAISVFGEVPDGLVEMLQDWGHVVRTVTVGDN
jgi:phage N-6-adenine-methyltransferase